MADKNIARARERASVEERAGSIENSTIPYPVPRRRRINIPLIGSLVGGAAVLLAGGLAYYLVKRSEYRIPPREPPGIERPVQLGDNQAPVVGLETPTPTATGTPLIGMPTIEPTVTPEVKRFEFQCLGCTQEETEKFERIAYDDYLSVLNVYGIYENNARMVIDISERGGIGYDFYFENRRGSSGGDFGKFISSSTHNKHEMAHAVNYAFFGTRDIPSWLNEGLAMYASGEIDTINGMQWVDFYGINGDGTINTKTSGGVLADDAYNLLKSNPELYWQRRVKGDASGHSIGPDFYSQLIRDYGLTQEKNRTAIGSMGDSLTRKSFTRRIVQEAYETALGLPTGGLDELFKLFEPVI